MSIQGVVSFTSRTIVRKLDKFQLPRLIKLQVAILSRKGYRFTGSFLTALGGSRPFQEAFKADKIMGLVKNYEKGSGEPVEDYLNKATGRKDIKFVNKTESVKSLLKQFSPNETIGNSRYYYFALGQDLFGVDDFDLSEEDTWPSSDNKLGSVPEPYFNF